MALRKVMTKELSPLVWFGTRRLDVVPRHFIKCPTPMTSESEQWVITKLSGRYVLSNNQRSLSAPFSVNSSSYFYFEEPKEAMLYELRWAGEENNSELF